MSLRSALPDAETGWASMRVAGDSTSNPVHSTATRRHTPDKTHAVIISSTVADVIGQN
jgi:hypothetical protein